MKALLCRGVRRVDPGSHHVVARLAVACGLLLASPFVRSPALAEHSALPTINVTGVGAVPTESDYVPHVVACENGAASFEALKVQAVAARTYAYYKMETAGAIGDGTGDQVYSCSHPPSQIHYDAVAATENQILTYQDDVIAAFYVAGARPSDPSGRAQVPPDPDPTGTEWAVTYPLLDGLVGAANQGSPLGFLGNPRNRGAMSQNGADFLSDNGHPYTYILPFYYGEDITLETAVPAVAHEILADDFESYADTPAMRAVWDEQSGGLGTLDASVGNPGQSMAHPGGTTSNRLFAPTTPTDDIPLIWEFDFRDDGGGNKRITGGLRDDGGGGDLGGILEMGRYNAAADPESETTISGYAVRTAFLDSDPANWVSFVGNPAVAAGWHHFKATIGASNVLFQLDLNRDGTIDGSRLVNTLAGAGIAYNVARFGGPSNLSSSGGGGHFDNLRIATAAGMPGDVNLDGQVNGLDVAPFADRVLNGVYQIEADMNDDGLVNGLDVDPFVGVVIGGDGAEAVPEPATAMLVFLATGWLGLAGAQRRRG